MPTATTEKPEYQYRRPWLYDKQREAIFDPIDHAGRPARFSCIEASTKSGKTVGCIVWLTEQAMAGDPGQNYWWIAPTYATAKIAFRRLMQGLPRWIFHANQQDLTIAIVGHGTIWFKSGEKPDNLYGEDVYAAVVDEASRCREDAWIAIRSTLTATRGPARIIGNVKGKKNWAYRMARRAESGVRGLSYYKITAYDAVEAGILALSEIEGAKEELTVGVFKELFMAEASDDEGNPFGLRDVRANIRPLSREPPKCWGWDLAKSVDWTVGIGVDAQNRVCRVERFQMPWRETRVRIIADTNGIPALIDSTGVGDPILEDLQHDGGRHFEGFKFTSESKQRLMEGLAVSIQKGTIYYPEGPVVNELESFEYQFTRTGVRYGAPEGLHDDCVVALALVNFKAKRPEARPRVRQL